MTVTLIGCGCGAADTMTAAALSAIRRSGLIIGAPRLLEGLPEGCASRRVGEIAPQKILELILAEDCPNPCVLYSGDTGFYSGARGLLPLLEARGIEARVLPGVSSVQALAAGLGRPWQDWALRSAHGADCDAVAEVCRGRAVCFLTGGALGPAELCRQLAEAGLGDLRVSVGERLSYPDETISSGTAAQFAGGTFAPLSVLLADPAPVFPRRTPGIPDEEFLRDKVPMTKQEVRAAVLAKLAVGPGDVCWDVGAGTGSVSVEMALQAKAVWAVEAKPDACGLIRANREKFGAWKLRVVEGTAPEALAGLPAPDAVFVGGSTGRLSSILKAVHAANPRARICVSAIALETLHAALTEFAALGFEAEAVQIAVSRAKTVGELHLLMAQNPVFLITGGPA